MLDIKHLTVQFEHEKKVTQAVADFSMHMNPGEIIGIVGESGSGKTMTALAIMRLLHAQAQIASGEILFHGEDLLKMDEAHIRQIRGAKIGMIFQEPMTSLDPLMRIGAQVEESLKLHETLPKEEYKSRAIDMMNRVGLENPEELYTKYPHELSGGMRQRVMIAAALICKPDLLIADEPTTALDVTIQSQILKLLKSINEKEGTGILFISHNLAVVRQLCENVLVMHEGRIVEAGQVDHIFEDPKEEYTKELIQAIPTRTNSMRRRELQ